MKAGDAVTVVVPTGSRVDAPRIEKAATVKAVSRSGYITLTGPRWKGIKFARDGREVKGVRWIETA